MCGIVGFVGEGDGGDLSRMLQALAHRGPDGQGTYIDSEKAVHIGHARLSIVDLADGQQPMFNADQTICVSFNGEIYNHQELRGELEAKGHRFRTAHSDTEVLVHGWAEWGEDLPLRLNGMFAFAILDKSRNSLFLARDRFGEKPLFWAQQNQTFYFASELSAIAAHTGFQARYNSLALKKYFAHGFIPAPHAAFQDAHKLPPGCTLTLNLQDHDLQIRPYWRFRIGQMEQVPSLEEAAEEVHSLFMASVKRRLMSDVPLGVFLSGGVDSSYSTAAMCQMRPPQDVKSFAIGFNEASYDESPYARAMAEALNTDHHEEILDIHAAQNLMSHVLGLLDEPMGDPSILPTYLLCRFARTKVKVALSGDGGDELFAGYDPFAALKPAALYHAVMPGFAHKTMRSLAELLPKSSANMSLDFKIRRVLQGLDHGPELWNPTWLAPLEVGDIEDIFNEPVATEDLYSEVLNLWHEDEHKNTVDKTLEFYSNYYLPDDILTKVDRASMFNGLEARSVFLDNDLVDYVRCLPTHYKFDGKNRKIVLKKAAQRLVPESILNRRKKGFGIPLKAWLADMSIESAGAEAFGMETQKVASFISDHQSGQRDHRLFLWNWSVLKRHLPLS